MKIIVEFDGGTRKGNPGIGYGSYRITIDDREPAVRNLDFKIVMTNNRAEYVTCWEAVNTLFRNQHVWGVIIPKETDIEVYGDSKLVIEQVNHRWVVNDEELKRWRDRICGRLNEFRSAKILWHPRAESMRIFGH